MDMNCLIKFLSSKTPLCANYTVGRRALRPYERQKCTAFMENAVMIYLKFVFKGDSYEKLQDFTTYFIHGS